eukprot:gene7287-8064_t
MESAQLIVDHPHKLVIIDIPQDEVDQCLSEGECLNINYKTLFHQLTHRKRKHEGMKKMESVLLPLSPGQAARGGLSDIGTRSSNLYNSVIDQLERKYCTPFGGAEVIEDGEEALSDHGSPAPSTPKLPTANSNGNGTTHDTGTATGTGTVYNSSHTQSPPSSKRLRRKKVFADDYDYSDMFIDDSEAVVQYEKMLQGKSTKTKVDGFFISSGDLEVEPLPKKARIKPIKVARSSDSHEKKKVSSDMLVSEGEVAPAVVVVDKDNPSDNNNNNSSEKVKSKDKDSVTKKQDKDKGKDKEVEEGVGGVGVDNKLMKEKEKVEKPLWKPAPEVLIALKEFQKAVETCRNRIRKRRPLPSELHSALLHYEKVVNQHHSARQISQTSGFYESIQTAVGVEVSALKIRTILNRLHLRDKSNESRTRVDKLINRIQNDLKANIKSCPLSKQPAYKLARKSLGGGGSSNKSDSKEVGKDGLIEVEGSTTVMDSEAAANRMEAEADTPAATAPIASELANYSEEAIYWNPETESTEANNTAAATAAGLPNYSWYCRWSVPLRQQLVHLEDSVTQWVLMENTYRGKLTNIDKEDMEEVEYAKLTIKEEFEAVLEKVAQAFPSSCLYGDVAAIKQAIKTERNRVMKEQKKEAAVAVTATPAETSSGAMEVSSLLLNPPPHYNTTP